MPTIAEIAAATPDLSILVAALGALDDAAGPDDLPLLPTLSDAGQDLTVFAPTNAAFGQLAVDLGFEGDPEDEDAVAGFVVGLGVDLVRTVVLYHVSAGAKTAADIAAADEIATLAGPTIDPALPRLIDLEPDLIDPAVTTPDIAADNGVVHLIDRVLLPADLEGNDVPTLLGTVAASDDFDILAAAVDLAGIGAALDDEGSDLTVFAPVDAAFADLAAALGYTGDAEDEAAVAGFVVEALTLLGRGDGIGLLTDVLTYHVAPVSLTSAQVLTGDPIPTLLGLDLGVDGTGPALVDAEPDLPNPGFVALDIQAAGGIAHAIDGVLIPADLLVSDGADDVDFQVLGDAGDVVALGADADFADGNGGADLLRGQRGDDVLLGGFGDDTLGGGKDADLILGEEDDDLLLGGKGRDTLQGGHGDDEIKGGRLRDILKGNGGDDVLVGGGGRDKLIGGRLDDTLTGGSGADTFVMRALPGDDEITDFAPSEDVLDLRGLGFADLDAVLDAAEEDRAGITIDLGVGSVTLLGLDEDDLAGATVLV